MLNQGCLTGLGSWIASSAIYWYFVHTRLAPLAGWNLSLAAGFVMVVAIGQLRAARRSSEEARSVARYSTFSSAPVELLRDGQSVVISGRIRPLGLPLTTPFTARPAVIYAYDIKHYRTRGRRLTLMEDYSGYALTPSVIDFPQGTLKLLGFPLLQSVPNELLKSESAKKNAAAYLAATTFTDTAFHPMAIYGELKHLMTDEMAELRTDHRIFEGTDLTGSQLFEQMVAPDEQVCVSGRYSAEKGGLVTDVSGGSVLTLMRGDAEVVAASLWRRTARSVIAGLAIAALGTGAVYEYVKAFSGMSPMAIVNRLRAQARLQPVDLHRAVKASDRVEMGRLLQAGLSANARDDDARTPLAMATDELTAQWLIGHGADVNAASPKGQTPLMDQAEFGRVAIMKRLIAAGAKLDLVNTEYKTSALAQARQFEKPEAVALLLAAGALDTEVTAKNGTPAAAESAPVRACLDYLDAIQREDRAACRRLEASPSEWKDFSGVKLSYPAKGRLAGGFLNDDAATIAIRGMAQGGTYVTYTFQLTRQSGDWKILDERWETHLDSKEP